MSAAAGEPAKLLGILLICEDAAFAGYLQTLLSKNRSTPTVFSHAPRLADALAGGHEKTDVILLSLSLPDAYGLHCLTPVRNVAPRSAIIVLAGMGSAAVSDALQLGAQDYLFKDQIDEQLLMRAMRYAIERRKSETRLASFAHLGHQLSAATTADEAARIIVGIADALLGWDACTFDLYSAETDTSTPVLRIDLLAGKRQDVPPLPDTTPTPTMRKVIAEGRQMILTPPQQRPVPNEMIPFGDVSRASESIMIVPIRRASKVIGLVSIHSYTPQAYDGEDLETLQDLADHCGGALDRISTAAALKLSEQQLSRALEVEAIGQLAAGIAHDFNNLLTVINGRSHAAMSQFDPGHPLHMELELIYKTGERAAELTRQLLAFSRRRPVRHPVAVDLNTVLANMNQMLVRIVRKDVEFNLVAGSSLDMVEADPGQVSHMIVNLVVNACDAMPKGGHLLIETSNVSLDAVTHANSHVGIAPGRYVLLSVKDSGCGMDEATKSRAFEPFFTTKQNGTGLGLSSVFGIVQQSGGQIVIESKPRNGTAIKIYLPVMKTPVQPSEPISESSESLNGTETILVVEDEENIREFTRHVLAAKGYKVLEARSCSEAILMYERHKSVDLLLTDVVMPRMSGRDLARILSTAHPGLKILFMSGYSDYASGPGGHLEPGTAFLQKPFTQTALWQKVRDVLSR